MLMSTQTMREAAALLAGQALVDSLQLHLVEAPVTIGRDVIRTTIPVGDPVDGLVQSSTLANAVESQTSNVYSIKVAQGVLLEAGMAVEVLLCEREPHLRGRMFLVDKVSENGLSLLRKATASAFETVDQQGKEGL